MSSRDRGAVGGTSDTTAFEWCHIVFWRGYVKCAFYAVPESGEPVGSPFFRSREPSPLQSGGPLQAHHALIERLEDEGWERVARGRAWYAMTFRRRSWSPADRPSVDEHSTVVAAIEAHGDPVAADAQFAPPPPEPERTPVAEPEPAPDVARPATTRRSRRQLALLIATAVLIALAIALGLTLFGANSAQGRDRSKMRPASPQEPRTQQLKHDAPNVSATRKQANVAPTTIVVTGARGASWVEARVGSQTGRPLFAGVVAQGQTVRVTAPVVWVTFGAAGNLDLRVNGRAPVPGTFNGTITALIDHGRVRSS